MNWIKSHLIWSAVVAISAIAVLLILLDLFQLGIFAFALAAASLAIARAAGVTDRLLQVRSKTFDVLLYSAFAASLTLLALVIPTG